MITIYGWSTRAVSIIPNSTMDTLSARTGTE